MTRLGGTCGIPRYDRRVYVKVACVDSAGVVEPTRDRLGRHPALPGALARRAAGVGPLGERQRRRGWRVEVAAGVWRTLWWERGRFFVERRDANGE